MNTSPIGTDQYKNITNISADFFSFFHPFIKAVDFDSLYKVQFFFTSKTMEELVFLIHSTWYSNHSITKRSY